VVDEALIPGSTRLRALARLIHGGGVVAYPTEAVYGLGCDPDNSGAVRHLLELKVRPSAKGLILITDDIERLRGWARDEALDDPVVRQSWPGPVTWLLPACPDTPDWIRGDHADIAVRVTAHPLAAALCRAVGMPLVSTSANRSGRPPARTAVRVARIFGDGLDGLLRGPVGGLRRPTEIRDFRSGAIVRAG
jgi:L-threonylcarbamoyladenylate synthase